MQLNIYTVYDSKTESYLAPFVMRSKGEALRAWETTVNDENTQFCKFPADFTLLEIGKFDDNDGTVVSYETKKNLGLALEYKRKPEAQLPLEQHIDAEKVGN